MGRVDFGWVIPMGPEAGQRETFVAAVDQCARRVTGRFTGLWAVDHLQERGADDLIEGWTTLAYFGARHPALQLGHVVLAQSFRNPALLAKMAATLQHLSGGRYTLGLGTGWHEGEYHAYGYAFPPPGVRLAQLDETVRIVRALWHEAPATFAGTHYQIREAYCAPKPDPIPPMLIGGLKPRMLRLIARHADWWCVSWMNAARYDPYLAEMERACAEVGRDPATLRRVWFGPCACAATEEAARAWTDARFTTERGFVGTPAQIVAQMRPFVERGVDYFILGVVDSPDPTGLTLLAEEVVPALNF